MYPTTTEANYYSDLINSYAWDTAIIFIQTYSANSTYASQESIYKDSNSPHQPANTGERGADSKIGANKTDNVCNIYDMASNVMEWSTETSSYKAQTGAIYNCVARGGFFNYTSYDEYPTKLRYYRQISYSNYAIAFRSVLNVSSTVE